MAPKRTAPAAKTAPAKLAAAAPTKATPAPTKTAVAKAAPAKEVVAKKTTQPQTRAQTKKTPVAAAAAPEKEKKEKDLFKKKKYVPLPEELSSDDETDFGKVMDKDMAPAAPTKISKTHTEEDQENDDSDDDFDDEELDRQIAQLREEFGEDDDDEESDDDEGGAEKEDQEMATAKAKFIEAKLAAKQAKAEGATVDDEEDDDDDDSDDDDDDSDDDGTKALARHLARSKPAVPRGTVFLGNIPFGFFENEMYGYFSQFGTITNLRLLRSKKTGNSKRCAFIEFEDEKVAEIVAETTSGYIMFNRILRCNVVPAETVKARKYWKWAKMNLDPVHVPPHLLAREINRRPKTLADMEKILKRQSIKEKRREKKLAELGITYDFPKLSKLAPKPSKRTVFDD